jgi:hypothetical protein
MSDERIRISRDPEQTSDDIEEHGLRTHHEASEGFDHSEPQAPKIWMFAVGSVIMLVLVIGAIQQYFDKVWNDAVTEKVLAPPSQELQDVRNRDDWNLTHYGYMDQKKGQVRIPLERAQELFLKEAAEGKTFYPAKPTLPKKDEDEKSPAAAPTPNQK